MPLATYTVEFDIDPDRDLPGAELGYASFVGMTAATAPVDVPGLQVTFIAGTRPVAVALEAMVSNDTAGQETRAIVQLDGVQIGFIPITPSVGNRWYPGSRTVRIPGLVAGSTHTVKVLVGRVSGGTALFGGDAQSPSSLSVVTR